MTIGYDVVVAVIFSGAKGVERSASEFATMIVIENFINGKFVASNSHIDSFNPSTGKVWAKVPASGSEEVELAVEAAEAALSE